MALRIIVSSFEVRRNGALSLLCEASGFEPDGTRAELAVIDNGFGELDFGTFHEVSLLAAAIRAADAEAGRRQKERGAQNVPADPCLVNGESAPGAGTLRPFGRPPAGDQLRAGLLRISRGDGSHSGGHRMTAGSMLPGRQARGL